MAAALPGTPVPLAAACGGPVFRGQEQARVRRPHVSRRSRRSASAAPHPTPVVSAEPVVQTEAPCGAGRPPRSAGPVVKEEMLRKPVCPPRMGGLAQEVAVGLGGAVGRRSAGFGGGSVIGGGGATGDGGASGRRSEGLGGGRSTARWSECRARGGPGGRSPGPGPRPGAGPGAGDGCGFRLRVIHSMAPTRCAWRAASGGGGGLAGRLGAGAGACTAGDVEWAALR